MPINYTPTTDDAAPQRAPRAPDIASWVGEGTTIQRLNTKPVIRQSTVTAFEDCPRKGLLQWAYCLRPYHRADALDKGNYAHGVLRLLIEGKTLDEVVDWCRYTHDKIVADVARHPLYDGKVANVPDETQRKYTKNMNIGLATGHRAFTVIDPLIQDGTLTVVATEVPLKGKLKIGNLEFDYAGQVDLLFKTPLGDMYPLDLKTTDEPPNIYAENLWSRLQRFLYPEALRQGLGGDIAKKYVSKVKGFLPLVCMKPGIIQKKATKSTEQESTRDYLKRCNDWLDGTGEYVKFALDRRANPPVALLPPMTYDAVPRWVARRIGTVLQYMTLPTLVDNFPPHERHCGDCLFRRMCKDETGSTWKRYVAENLTQTPDPLDSDPSRVPLTVLKNS